MPNTPILIGHRGFRHLYPENTLISFEKAIEMGVSAVEFDVQTTKDGYQVISHDSNLGRCCDHQGTISELTLSELKSYDFGSWKAPEFAGTRIPTLDELLDFILAKKPDIFLCCEVKDNNPATASACYQALKQRDKLSECSFISFYYSQLERLFQMQEDTPLLLHGFRCQDMHDCPPGGYRILNRVGIYIADVRKEEVEEFNHYDIDVDSWGVNDEETLEKAISCGVHTLTSDNLDVTVPLMKARGLMPVAH